MYYAKVWRSVSGEASEATEGAREVPVAMCLASVVLAVLCLATALVILPSVRGHLIDPAVRVFAPAEAASEPATARAVPTDGEIGTPAAAQVAAKEGMTP